MRIRTVPLLGFLLVTTLGIAGVAAGGATSRSSGTAVPLVAATPEASPSPSAHTAAATSAWASRSPVATDSPVADGLSDGTFTITSAVATGAPADTALDPSPAAADGSALGQLTVEAGVTIISTAFSPATLEVVTGATVRWTNKDPIVHTVNARDGSFGSGILPPGAEYSHRFETAGTYDYFCAVHPGQVGTVVVTAPAAEEAADPGG